MQANIKRLVTLADFLRGLGEKAFCIDSWFSPGFGDLIDKGNANPESAADCGTTACALGWATTIQEFKAAGLSSVGVKQMSGYTPLVPTYDGLNGIDAAMRFFDISESVARSFFLPSAFEAGDEALAEAVAARICAFVEDQSGYEEALDGDGDLCSKDDIYFWDDEPTERDLAKIKAGDELRARLPEFAW